MKIFYLYALGLVDRNIGLYLETMIVPNQAKLVRESIVRLCNEIAEVSVKLIDAIASPDKALGSAIGMKDGQAYTHLIECVESASHVYDKPEWLPHLIEIREKSKKLIP